jgi:hypothetical protein
VAGEPTAGRYRDRRAAVVRAGNARVSTEQQLSAPRLLPRWVLALPADDAARRVSAWIYGTVLALAALTLVTPEASDEAGGAGLLIGIGLGTFLAHLFADYIGEEVRERRRLTGDERREILRDLLPVLTGMVPPAVFLAIGVLPSVSGPWMLALAFTVTLLRLPLIALIVAARTQRHPLWSLFIVCGLGILVVVIKVLVSH